MPENHRARNIINWVPSGLGDFLHLSCQLPLDHAIARSLTLALSLSFSQLWLEATSSVLSLWEMQPPPPHALSLSVYLFLHQTRTSCTLGQRQVFPSSIEVCRTMQISRGLREPEYLKITFKMAGHHAVLNFSSLRGLKLWLQREVKPANDQSSRSTFKEDVRPELKISLLFYLFARCHFLDE